MPDIFPVALIMAGLWGAPAHAELDARAIAFNCQNCHALEQSSDESSIPALNSLSKQRIHQALLDFKYDKKTATLMPRLAKGYSDAELAAVADYLGRD